VVDLEERAAALAPMKAREKAEIWLKSILTDLVFGIGLFGGGRVFGREIRC
jgi:hypothetical protein